MHFLGPHPREKWVIFDGLCEVIGVVRPRWSFLYASSSFLPMWNKWLPTRISTKKSDLLSQVAFVVPPGVEGRALARARGIPCGGAPTVRAIKSIPPQPILIVSTAVEMAELQGCKATAVCVASEHACMIRLCRANSEGILYSPATQMVGCLYKHKKRPTFAGRLCGTTRKHF